jgi:hypothetical protein
MPYVAANLHKKNIFPAGCDCWAQGLVIDHVDWSGGLSLQQQVEKDSLHRP